MFIQQKCQKQKRGKTEKPNEQRRGIFLKQRKSSAYTTTLAVREK